MRSEFEPGTGGAAHEKRLLSSDPGHDAEGAQRLKWPESAGQAQFKSMVLALVRLFRRRQGDRMPPGEVELLCGPGGTQPEAAKNPAKALAYSLAAVAGRFSWVEEFCGVRDDGKAALARYFRTAGLKADKDDPASTHEVRVKYVPGEPALRVVVLVRRADSTQAEAATTRELHDIESGLVALPDWDGDWASSQLAALSGASPSPAPDEPMAGFPPTAPRPLPPLTTVLGGPEARREYATCIRALLRKVFLPAEDSRSDEAGGRGRFAQENVAMILEDSTTRRAFLALPWWPEEAGRINQAETEAICSCTSGEPLARAGLTTLLLVTPQDLDSESQARLLPTVNRTCRLELKLAGPAEIAAWLWRCPSLLAHYYPQVAASLAPPPGAAPFSGQPWKTIRDELLRRSLPGWSDLRIERMSARLTSEEDRPSNVQLPDVFVPQQFIPQGQTVAEGQSLAVLLAANRPVVLLGDPGAGKSTVLNALALASAGSYAIPDTATPPRVPLILPLRKYARGRAQRPGLLEACVHQARSSGLSPGDGHPWFFEGLIELGKAIVLFDGLDEAGDRATRRWVVQQIEEFHRRHPLCCVWVTSRKVGYDGAPLDKAEFSTWTVAPFDAERRALFVQRWYHDQHRHEPVKAATYAESLLKALERSRSDVQHMGGNPLLLTLMALIHHSKNGRLPHNRGELYEECVELLLQRWERAKPDPEEADHGGDLASLKPPIGQGELRRYLATIAFEVQERNEARGLEEWGNIPSDFLRERLVDLRQRTRGDADPAAAKADVEVLLRYCQSRSGLLVWKGEDTYAFSHLSFQEYLAACMRHGGDFRFADHVAFFALKAGEPKWRETLILLLHRLQSSSTAVKPFTEHLMDFLVGHASGRPPDQAAPIWRTLGMALRDEIAFAPAHQRQILDQILRDWLIEPRFDTEAFALLEDLGLFATRLHATLTGLLRERWQTGPSDQVWSALHLRIRLLGWPAHDPGESAGLAREFGERLAAARGASRPAQLTAQAGIILATAVPERVAQTEPGAQLVRTVRQLLGKDMFDLRLRIRDRSDAATALGRLGDERAGVGVGAKDGVPVLDWIEIAPGPFIMGSKKGETEFKDETPQFECSLIRHAYRISRYPVTVRQYRAFVEAEGYEDDGSDEATRRLKTWWRIEGLAWKRKEKITGPKDYQSVFQTPNHPRVGVSWYEAIAFCRWLTERLRATGELGKKERVTLPTEAQWERAARHTDGRKYPWEGEGEDLAQRCNMAESGIGHTSAVGLFPNGLAKCGAADMSGNVLEWCRTKWRDDYVKYEQRVDDTLDGEDLRVLRGGSWFGDGPAGLSCSFRFRRLPGNRDQVYGFRCVVMDDGSA